MITFTHFLVLRGEANNMGNLMIYQVVLTGERLDIYCENKDYARNVIKVSVVKARNSMILGRASASQENSTRDVYKP